MHRSFLVLLLLALGTPSASHAADLRSRAEVGLGFTDNANLEDSDRDSDLFWRLASANTLAIDEHRAGVRFGYVDYVSQSDNDAFSWRASDRWNPERGAWSFGGGLFGQHYTNGAPANTDYGFDNVGFDLGAERFIAPGPRSELVVGPGYQLRQFSNFAGRTDHYFYGMGDFSYSLNTRLTLGSRAELGWVASDLPDYGKFIFEGAGSFEYSWSRDWTWSGEMTLRRSQFLERTISTETVTSRSRGKRVTSVLNEKESYSFFEIASRASRALTPSQSLIGGISHCRQSSKSGLQDYSAFEITGQYRIMF